MSFVTVFAQAAAGQTATGPSPFGTLFMFGSIFAIFYFLVIRPQSKQRKDHETKVMALKKGDQIVTAGGIVGEVVHIAASMKDGATVSTLNDHVTIKSGDSKLVVTRARIAAVGNEEIAP